MLSVSLSSLCVTSHLYHNDRLVAALPYRSGNITTGILIVATTDGQDERDSSRRRVHGRSRPLRHEEQRPELHLCPCELKSPSFLPHRLFSQLEMSFERAYPPWSLPDFGENGIERLIAPRPVRGRNVIRGDLGSGARDSQSLARCAFRQA